MKYLSTVTVPTTLASDLGSKPGHPPLLRSTGTCLCGPGRSMEQTGSLGQRQEQLRGCEWDNCKVVLRQFGTSLQLLGFSKGVRKITGNSLSAKRACDFCFNLESSQISILARALKLSFARGSQPTGSSEAQSEAPVWNQLLRRSPPEPAWGWQSYRELRG